MIITDAASEMELFSVVYPFVGVFVNTINLDA